jgi:hypothetical protein
MKGETLMDSSKKYPRSVHEKYLGVVQLARTVDKARMLATGSIGEYHYDCPMDQALFSKFGIDAKQLAQLVSEVAKDPARNADLEAYLKPLIGKKSQAEIDAFNREVETNKPVGESLKHFEELRARIAPKRTDITSWPDILDIDEGRHVPERVLSPA